MTVSHGTHAAHVFVGQRMLAVICMPILMGLMFWSTVGGAVALVVTLWWFGRIGVPVADAWASARVRGRSIRGAAAEANWGQSFVVLGGAVVLALAVVTLLRHLTPLGGWLGDPGLTKPLTAALVLLTSSIPGILVVRRHAARFRREPAPAEAEDLIVTSELAPLAGLQWWALALLAALFLSVVNVAVMFALFPIGGWFEGDAVARPLAIALLVVMAVMPFVAVGLADRVRRRSNARP